MKKLLVTSLVVTGMASMVAATDIPEVILADEEAKQSYTWGAIVSKAIECGVEEKLFSASDQATLILSISSNNVKRAERYGREVHLAAMKAYAERVQVYMDRNEGCKTQMIVDAKTTLMGNLHSLHNSTPN
ncbi:MAG: hypothetical protein EP335_11855 [Alphaproteobacteria bacterium]|nr:MAG: hypothetical protein EP335_11855 [Alphaproteobacteria bacterium]